MPIIGPPAFSPIGQEEFAQLDYRVMRLAFDCQNQLGRLCDESIYQNDLAARLDATGLSAATEVPVTVAHEGFAKTYSLDLVVAQAGIYELKAALALVGAHEAQVLNYLFLCGGQHGKLVNFRPAHVESRFINATLTPAERRQFTVELDGWHERDEKDRVFRERLIALLNDWGCGLDLALYTEALIHFTAGEGCGARLLPLTRDAATLGKQCFHLLSPETAFRLSTLTEGTSEYEHQLRSLLRLSPLRTLQWVNLARQRVQFVSLMR